MTRCHRCRRPTHTRGNPTPGTVPNEARGLCRSCYRWARTHNALHKYERVNQPRGEILHDWAHLADPLRPLKEEIARLAPRLGLTEKALESRLHRAGIRSRYQGGWGQRPKDNR